MKIVVFGATGPSGLTLVQQALERGMGVTALVRNPDRLNITHDNLKVEKVNIFKEEDILDHIKECDVVMGCLGSHGSFFSRLSENLYTESTKVILSAMRKAGKKRFVVISAGGVIKTSQEPILMTIFRPLKISEVLSNMREMEIMLQNSTDIDFTAVRAPGLTNSQGTDKEIKTEVDTQFVAGARFWISRADVTRFMLDCAEKETFKRQCVAIAT